MTIETKYGIGDVVYFIEQSKIHKGTVKDIMVTSLRDKVISYTIIEGNSTGSWETMRREGLLFATQDDLFNSLRLE